MIKPTLICPMRKSGGPCVKDECAWWTTEDESCAVLDIADSLARIVNIMVSKNTITVDKDYHTPILPNTNGYDDDIPF